MLSELRIQGLGVIDDATLSLRPGLNVLTGETGAGKTMVVSGLGLLLGERADSSRVRTGLDSATVEGVVTVRSDHPAAQRAVEAGAQLDIDDDTSDDGHAQEGELVLVRTVPREGRSRAHIGGRTTPVGVLSEVGHRLVAVHGQADQWRLKRPEEHRALLDDFGAAPVTAARDRVGALHEELRTIGAELETLHTQRRERAQEADVLRVGLERIEQVDPQPGEDAELAAESTRLGHVDSLRASVGASVIALLGDEATVGEQQDAASLLAAARTSLREAAALDPALESLSARMDELVVLTSELGADLAAYESGIDADPGRLEQVEQRRAQLQELTRRYGDSIDDVLAWGQRSAQRLTELEGDDERITTLEARRDELDAQLRAAADELTRLRTSAASDLAARVTEELSHLAMGRAVVEIAVEPLPTGIGPEGQDAVEIRVAANPGTPALTVTKAASGGELSRIMLAIEVVTGKADAELTHPVPATFVFDEVDAGVGGSAALDVGSRLAALARNRQVLVVTHLAQVAAFADNHLVVTKSVEGAGKGSRTTSRVLRVEGDERLAELSRMMGGDPDSEAGLAHARDLTGQAAEVMTRWGNNGSLPAQTTRRRGTARGGRSGAR